MEEAGVVVRVPNWWSARRKPRPKVQVKLGTQAASQVGLEAMLEFQIHVTLDGEPLSEEEREERQKRKRPPMLD
jgi:non-specific serine/threonine protein kinase